jgi:hypothetical protein
MYAANVVEGNWTARTNVDAVGTTAALLEEVRRRNDVRLICLLIITRRRQNRETLS